VFKTTFKHMPVTLYHW